MQNFFIIRYSGFVKNLIIFRVNNSSSVHANNRKRDTLIIGKGPSQRLNMTLD